MATTKRSIRIPAAFMLLISLPAAVYETGNGTLGNWLIVVCCAAGGIGLALGARTGHWFNSPA